MAPVAAPSGPSDFSAGRSAPSPLAVLCLSDSLGGLELNSLKFAAWMQERGWAVTFFAPPASPLAALAARWAVPLEVARPRRGLRLLAAAQALRHQLDQRGITTLILTQNKDLGLVTLAKLLMGSRLRVVYQQHMQLGLAKRDLFHTWRFGLVDAWLSPLPSLGRQVLEKTRFPAGRVHVVPLGLPIRQFSAAPQPKAVLRQALHLPAERALLGILGRLDDGKGQDFVIKVLHQLRQEGLVNADLVIMGELTRNEGDAYLQKLRAMVRELGLEQHVHFREFQEDPAVFYHAIDVFVLASTNETYGMVTLEAMAAGVPIVAAATGGTLELVQDGRTGLLYPLGDVDACARNVRWCLEQPALAATLVAQARQAVQQYSHQRQCELTEEVLNGVETVKPAAGPGPG